MATFKCKMCDETIEVKQGETVGTCKFCKMTQTVAKTDDKILRSMFSKANGLRLYQEYDKAAQVYKSILEKEENETEAHWGLVLCRYGVEYINKAKSRNKLIICHKTAYEPIKNDSDYKAALETADDAQRELIRKDAREIDKIQKNNLESGKMGKLFDVFICCAGVKNGKNTAEGDIAEKFYQKLTKDGFSVFYAPVTLEEKFGMEWEPFIYDALNSSQTMIVIGTKINSFKEDAMLEEWTLFRQLMRKDKTKRLFPCYKGIFPHQLPKELVKLKPMDIADKNTIANLESEIAKASDAGKLAKAEKEEKNAEEVYAEVPDEVSEDVYDETSDEAFEDFAEEAVGDAVEDAVEDAVGDIAEEMAEDVAEDVTETEESEETQEASEDFAEEAEEEEIIQEDPNLEEIHAEDIKDIEDIENIENIAEKSEEKAEIAEITEKPEDKTAAEPEDNEESPKIMPKPVERDKNEEERIKKQYFTGKKMLETANSEQTYREVAKIFEEIWQFRDSESLRKMCMEKAAACRQEEIYKSAIALMKDDKISSYEDAISMFELDPEWKDSKEKIKECNRRIEQIKAKEIKTALEKEQIKKEERHQKRQDKADALWNFIKITCIVLIVLSVIVIAAFFIIKAVKPDFLAKFGINFGKMSGAIQRVFKK